MVACDWCKEKKDGKWHLAITVKEKGNYSDTSKVDVMLCDAHYEPIRKAVVAEGGEKE